MTETRSDRRGSFSRRSKAGFTIVEVLFASFVLVLAIGSSILVIQAGYRSLDNARNTNLASQILQSEMERIRLLSWGALNLLPESAPVPATEILPADLSGIGQLAGRFTIRRELADVPDKVGEMKRITVTVTWRGMDRITHTRSATTHYAKDGLYAYYYTKAGG